MVELRWSKMPISDLDDIISYISIDSEKDAKLFAARIIDIIETTSTFPYSGRFVPELHDEVIREKVFN